MSDSTRITAASDPFATQNRSGVLNDDLPDSGSYDISDRLDSQFHYGASFDGSQRAPGNPQPDPPGSRRLGDTLLPTKMQLPSNDAASK
jgi:hypothetical protein